MIPHLSWQTWIIIVLVGLIFLILESSYRLISPKQDEIANLKTQLQAQAARLAALECGEMVMVAKRDLRFAVSVLEINVDAKKLDCTTWFEKLKAVLDGKIETP